MNMYTIYNFCCINSECTNSKNQRVKLEDHESADDVFCDICEQKMKLLGRECNVHAKFSSLSLKDKKALLKKRSTEHYNKNIKERKEYLDRSVTEQ